MLLHTPYGLRQAATRAADLTGFGLGDASDGRILSWGAAGGVNGVSMNQALGLPPVMRAIAILADTFASMPVEVVRRSGGVPEVVENAPQHQLIAVRPNEVQSSVDLWQYVLTCLLGWGNAYLLKIKNRRGEVLELWPLDPARVRILGQGFDLKFEYVAVGGELQTYTNAQILHIPGRTLAGDPFVGVSPIALHRIALGEQVSIQDHSSSFWRNDATPAMAVLTERNKGMNEDQKKVFRESLAARNKGPSKAGNFAILPSGVTIERLGISPRDAQYVEQKRFGSRQASMIFGVPLLMLDPDERVQPPPFEQLVSTLTTLSLGFWVRRIAGRVNADPDIFGASTPLEPRWRIDELLHLDPLTRAKVDHLRRQAGIKTANEIRKELGLPPHEAGDDLQNTPVGGAPNADTEPAAGGSAAPDDEEDQQDG